MSASLPSPTKIWRIGIISVEITPDLTLVEIISVDAPLLPSVDVCSIFKDDAISITAIDSPSTLTRKVRAAGNIRFSNSLPKDKNF